MPRASRDRHRGTPDSAPLGQRQHALFTPANCRATRRHAPPTPPRLRTAVRSSHRPRSRPSLLRPSKRSAATSGQAFRQPSCFRPRSPSPVADRWPCRHDAPAIPMSAFSATLRNRSPADRNRSRSCQRPPAPTATSARLKRGPSRYPRNPCPRRPATLRPSTSSG